MNQEKLRHVISVTRAAMDAIRSYTWPSNVRELRNAIEYAFVVGEETILNVQNLTPKLRGDSLPDSSTQSLSEAERERILTALTRHNDRRAAAATDLRISRSTLWRKLYAHRLR